MSKLTITRNENEKITRINGVKPLVTLLGFLDSKELSDDEETYVESVYFVVCDTTGYILHSISGEIEDKLTEEYDLSDLETAFIFYNKMTDAVQETFNIPKQLLKRGKLLKRYEKMTDKLVSIHPDFYEEYVSRLHMMDAAYTEECEQEEINKVELHFCGMAKKVIDEVEDMVCRFNRLEVSHETASFFYNGARTYLVNGLSKVFTEIHDCSSCDEDMQREIFTYVNNFINEYNHISCLGEIKIAFA